MSISGVGASTGLPVPGTNTQPSGQNMPTGTGTGGIAKTDEPTGAQEFLDYMKESPAQRMEDKWLRAHGLTKEKLDAMTPAQQKAVMDQMKHDIEQQMKDAMKVQMNKNQGRVGMTPSETATQVDLLV